MQCWGLRDDVAVEGHTAVLKMFYIETMVQICSDWV